MNDVVDEQPDEDEPRIVRILGDSTSRAKVRVPPDTTIPTTADGNVDVIPILPGSAYDRGPSVPLDV